MIRAQIKVVDNIVLVQVSGQSGSGFKPVLGKSCKILERKMPLAGFAGMLNFADEVYSTLMTPVWKLNTVFSPPKPGTVRTARVQ